MVQQRALGRAADDAAEVRARTARRRAPCAPRSGGEDHDLLLVVVERRGTCSRALAAGDRGDREVVGVDVGVRAERRRSVCGGFVASAQHGVLVGGAHARRIVASSSPPRCSRSAPCSTSSRRYSGPRPRRTACGSSSRGVGARVEQQPHVLQPLVVERVGEHDRLDGRAVLEQRAQALRARRLGRVVDRLAVVGVRARLEQHARELGIVDDARRAVERGHLAVLVGERRVRVRAAREQRRARAPPRRRRSGRRRAAAPSRAGRRARSRRPPSPRRARAAPTGRARSRAARRGSPRRGRGGRTWRRGRTPGLAPRARRSYDNAAMRAIVITKKGGPDVLELRDEPEPDAGRGRAARRGRGRRRQLPRRLRARGPRRRLRARQGAADRRRRGRGHGAARRRASSPRATASPGRPRRPATPSASRSRWRNAVPVPDGVVLRARRRRAAAGHDRALPLALDLPGRSRRRRARARGRRRRRAAADADGQGAAAGA